MGFRIVTISNPAKLSFKDNFLLIRGEQTHMVHLSEINIIIIETQMVQITARLLSELVNFKIKLIICDEKHNPTAEFVPYNSNYHSSKQIFLQTQWLQKRKDYLWMNIIANKIKNQSKLLEKNKLEFQKLNEYITQIEPGDVTNREGHSAKVYFNQLFGKDFSRDDGSKISKALDYGYTILLSAFNRVIANLGYVNQLGIKHKNEFNSFNLACDLIEPFRVLVDEIVFKNKEKELNREYKDELINVLNAQINYNGKNVFVINAITLYCTICLSILNNENLTEYVPYEYGI